MFVMNVRKLVLSTLILATTIIVVNFISTPILGAVNSNWLDSQGDNIYVVWWNNGTGNWDVSFARSTDNGETFEKTINLSNNTGESQDARVDVSGENVNVIWWDNQTGKKQIFFRGSTNGGETFGPIVILNASSPARNLTTVSE
jgi:phage terminase large subunit-like protein